jgi:hypothetical protein
VKSNPTKLHILPIFLILTILILPSGVFAAGTVPQAVTTSATHIANVKPGSNLGSAQLHGTISPNGAFTTAWFEYGTTPSLGSRTGEISIQATVPTFEYSAVVLGLQSATHYYRVVAQNENGVSQGSLVTFVVQTETVAGVSTGASSGTSSSSGSSGGQSRATATPTPKDGNFFGVITGNEDKSKSNLYIQFVRDTNLGSNNSATVISSQDDLVNAGESFKYAVLFKNDSDQKLDGVSLKITLPAEVEFNFSNIEPSENSGGFLEYNIGSLNPGETKELVIDVNIKRDARVGKHLVFSSILEYSGSDGKAKSVTSYSLALVEGVVAVAQGSNWLSGFIGTISSFFSLLWLGAALLLAVAVYLLYLYRRNRKIILDELNKGPSKPFPPAPVQPIPTLSKPEPSKIPDNLPGFPTGPGEPLRYRPDGHK